MAEKEKSLFELALEAEKFSKAEAKQVEQKAAQQKTEKPVRDVGMIEDVAKSLGSGIGRGVTGIAGMGGDIEQLARLETGRLEEAMPEEATAAMPYASLARQVEAIPTRPMVAMDRPTMLPTSKQVYRGLESTVLPEGTLTYKPQTGAGRTLQMGGEFFGGGLAPVGKAKTILKGSALMGGVGTTAGGISEISPEAGVAFGLLASPVVGAARARKTALEKRMSEVVGEQTPEALRLASQRQQAAKEVGVPLTAAEALDSQSLRNLAGMVATTPEGKAVMSPIISARKEQIPQAIERGLLEVGAQPAEPLLVGRKATKAAESALTKAYKNRSEAVDDLYTEARGESVSKDSIADIIKAVQSELKTSMGASSKNALRQFLNDISTVKKKKVTDPKTGKEKIVKERVPITKVGKLHDEQTAREDALFIKGDDPASKEAKQKAAAVRKFNRMLGDVLKSENANISAADDIYKNMSEDISRKLGDTGVKKIAEAGGNPDKIIKTISSSDDVSKPISSIAKELNKSDKTAFLEVAKLWLYRTGSDAQRTSTTGEMLQSAGVRFNNALRGTPNQKKNLSAVLDGVSSAKGHDFAQARSFKEGFNKMLDVLQRTNLIEKMGSPTQPLQEFSKEVRAQAPFSAKIMGIDVARPLGSFSEARVSAFESKTYDQIARALVDDDAVNAVMELAKLAPESRRAQAIVSSLVNPVREISQSIQPEGQEINPLGLLAQ